MNPTDPKGAADAASLAPETPPVALKAEALARQFHEAYERLAPSFGYETRTETRAFDPDSPNGKLMIAVCGEVATPDAAAMREALEAARAKFAFYREEHRNKAGKFAMTNGAHSPECLASLEKAAVNDGMAAMMDRALSTPTEAGIGAGTPTPGSGKHDAPVPMLDPVHLAGGGAHVADAPGTFSAGIGAGEGEATIPAGMKPWHGGDSAPNDWDGGEVLFRNGQIGHHKLANEWFSWSREEEAADAEHDIIAYTPKPPAALDEQRAGEVLGEVARIVGLLRHNLEDEDRRMAVENCDALIEYLESGEPVRDLSSARKLAIAIRERIGADRSEGRAAGSLVRKVGAYLIATSPRAAGDRLRDDTVAIWSGEHNAYWQRGHDGSGAGYVGEATRAGLWLRADAERMTSHCGSDKLIRLHDRPGVAAAALRSVDAEAGA